MDSLDLGTVVLNWNGLEDTLACLGSIYEQKSVPAYVVLVDNGSVDGSVQGVHAWLKAHPRFRASDAREGVRAEQGVRAFVLQDRESSLAGGEQRDLSCRFVTIENGKNLGFSAGNNVGIRYLMGCGVKYILLLNNDTLLGPDAFGILVAAMEESPLCQCMVPQIRYSGAPDRIWNCGGDWSSFGTPRYHYAEGNIAALEGKGPFEVELVTGCALIIRAAWLETHGMLTERFFLGEEDVDLSWRMRATGRGSMYCWPQAVIYHKVGASLTKRTEIALLPKVYVHYLNRMIFLRRMWGKGYRWRSRRIVVLSYFVWKLIFKMGVAPSDAIRIVSDFARDSTEKDGVNAEFFSWLMNEKFKGVRAA